MLLEKLIIENYGVYADKSEFILSSTPEKPIILIGGLNGAGKTTIFESIMIALYGKTYLGRRTTKKEYMKFIAQRMHKHEGKYSSTASVEIIFRFYHNGYNDKYIVNRSWTREGSSVYEKLSVQKNDHIMNEIDESQWQSFIEGLLPFGIARLFFFDGEKIISMTEWSNTSDEIKLSLDTLLGADLIHRLYADLDLYTIRNSGKTSTEDKRIQKEFENMKQEKETLVSEIKLLDIERERKLEEIHKTSSKIEVKESQIAEVGGGYMNIRENLITEKAVLEEKLRHLKKTIHEELSEDAPLYLMPEIMLKIKKQIEQDVETSRKKTSASLISEKVSKLKEELYSKKLFPQNIDNTSFFDMIIKKLEEMFKAPSDDAFFDMSSNQSTQMLQKIASIDDEHGLLLTKIAEYRKIINHYERVESNLVKIPKDDELGPRITKINSLHQEVGILKSEIAYIDQQTSSKKSQQKIIQNKLKKLVESIHRNKISNTGVQLASKMQLVLDGYLDSLKERKLKQLEDNLLNAASVLLHKKHIQKIKIDRQTLEIIVYEYNDDNPSSIGSMGERQIIGTALLWAIAKTSGRSLPFVIDTPLGRLDGKHLSNLTDKFYPAASHQIILLSTDREIGQKEYSKLSKYISRSYRIVCNEQKSVTTVNEGYFMEDTIAQTR